METKGAMALIVSPPSTAVFSAPAGNRAMGGGSGLDWLGIIAAGHRFEDRVDGNGPETSLFSTFGTAVFNNKDFVVTVSDATASGLSKTELDSGIGPRVPP
jgi:hypothetical protein